jgi:hypothetical protein
VSTEPKFVQQILNRLKVFAIVFSNSPQSVFDNLKTQSSCYRFFKRLKTCSTFFQQTHSSLYCFQQTQSSFNRFQ